MRSEPPPQDGDTFRPGGAPAVGMTADGRPKWRFCAARLLVLVLVLGMGSAHAAPEPADARFYFFAAIGKFQGEVSNDHLANERSTHAFMLGLGYRYLPHLNLEIAVSEYSREYDAPPTPPTLLATDTLFLLRTTGVSANLKLVQPLGRAVFYDGIGAGYFVSRAEVTIYYPLFLGSSTVQSERDANLGRLAMVGADVGLTGPHRLGVEYRRLWLDGSFSELAGGSVRIGGEAVTLNYRRAIAF